jgi:predicted amidophosphoribosyltransferase
MPRIYIHLVNKDVEKVIDELYGIEEEKPKLAKPVRCPRCGKVNKPNAKYCSQCALILDEGERIKVEMEEPLIAKELTEMLIQNPELLNQLKEVYEFVKEMREKPEIMKMLMKLREENDTKIKTK